RIRDAHVAGRFARRDEAPASIAWWTGYFCRTCTLANVAPRPLLVSKTMMKPLRGKGTCGSCAADFTVNVLGPVPGPEPPGIVTQSSAVAPGSAAHCDPGAVVT